MSVSISNQAPAAIGGGSRSFTENFDYGNGFLLDAGGPWVYLSNFPQLYGSAVFNPGNFQHIAQGINIIGNQLVVSTAGGAATICQARMLMAPALVLANSVLTSNQFSQLVIVADTSIGLTAVNRMGPCVLAAQSTPGFLSVGNGYYLEIRGELLELALYRGLGVGGTGTGTTLLATLPASFVMGDTIRLTAEIQSTKNVVKVYVNGVELNSTDDSNAARPLKGFPGMYFAYNGDNATSTTIDSWSGGKL